jgi:hypothetical protein
VDSTYLGVRKIQILVYEYFWDILDRRREEKGRAN